MVKIASLKERLAYRYGEGQIFREAGEEINENHQRELGDPIDYDDAWLIAVCFDIAIDDVQPELDRILRNSIARERYAAKKAA